MNQIVQSEDKNWAPFQYLATAMDVVKTGDDEGAWELVKQATMASEDMDPEKKHIFETLVAPISTRVATYSMNKRRG